MDCAGYWGKRGGGEERHAFRLGVIENKRQSKRMGKKGEGEREKERKC